MAQEQPRLRGAVREVGLSRDGDRFDNFTVTIGIQVRTEGRVTYDEAEKLAARYRREYLGKEVEFLSVNLPCPVCGKVLNSEVGLKGHIRQSHPERADLLKEEKPEPRKAKKEKPKKAPAKTPKKTRRPTKKTPKAAAKAVKAPAPRATKAAAKKAEKPRAAKAEPEPPKQAKTRNPAAEAKKTPTRREKPEAKPASKPSRKINGRQTRLA